jgi:hypothetical protein
MTYPALNIPHSANVSSHVFATGRMRWLADKANPSQPRLQQEWAADWRNELGGGRVTEWHDVPVEVAT